MASLENDRSRVSVLEFWKVGPSFFKGYQPYLTSNLHPSLPLFSSTFYDGSPPLPNRQLSFRGAKRGKAPKFNMKRPLPWADQVDVISDDSSDAENNYVAAEGADSNDHHHHQHLPQQETDFDSQGDDNEECRNVPRIHEGASHSIAPGLSDSLFLMDGVGEIDEATLWTAFALHHQPPSQTMG
ncbi:hypothetical protein LINPERHAP1_LOCUS25263 [Linum perenne]